MTKTCKETGVTATLGPNGRGWMLAVPSTMTEGEWLPVVRRLMDDLKPPAVTPHTIVGTVAKATAADWQAMKAEGIA